MDTGVRKVRLREVDDADASVAGRAIDEMYDDALDVLVVRRSFDPALMSRIGAGLDRDDRSRPWARPNQRMPVEDIQLLGTDAPATPTYQAPRGASLDEYLDSAARHGSERDAPFAGTFDPAKEFRRVLSEFAGGRPVDVPTAADGRTYVPFTVRRLVAGKQIGLHHDYHYPLPLYSDLAPRLDTRTLVSFVTTLLAPEEGGELKVYGITPDSPNPPKMPNGFQWDLDAVEKGFDSVTVTTAPGDLFLLASGRCLHRVAPIVGPRGRVTMGGFLALNKDGDRVFCWS